MTAMTFPILAIDLGKYKSVACWYDPATGAARFEAFSTSAAAVTRLVGDRRAAVVIEACALCGWVGDLCRELGVALPRGQHRQRGVEVQARQAQDRPRRCPETGSAVRPEATADRVDPGQGRA